MTLLTFTIILSIFNNTYYIAELSGLSRKNKPLAITFSIVLFSIGGLPPLAGFLSKYLVLLEAIGNGYILLSIFAIITSAVAIFYYIRIVK